MLTFREASQPYRVLIESMNEGAALLTAGGLVSYGNRQLAALIGAQQEEFVGARLRDWVAPAFRAIYDTLLEQAREAPARAELELLAAGRAGTAVELSLGSARVDGVLVICAVAIDLTERKQHEALSREMREQLAGRERLLSVASHELRTPLNVLSTVLGVLDRQLRKRDGSQLSEERTRVLLERGMRQVSRLAGLVNSLLDVARVGSGQLQLELEDDVDLAETAAEAVERLQEEIADSGTPVTLERQEIRGRWDRMRLEQVAVNLLSNAIKYGEGRPVEITISGDERVARLAVRDHGAGIAPEALQRIFQPFERASAVQNDNSLGLGLYICNEIVTAHGGNIQVASEPGQGSRFLVELPRIS